MQTQNIAVIGAGSWGTALALSLSHNYKQVDLWVFEDELCDIIQKKQQNEWFLSGIDLPSNIQASSDLEKIAKKHSIFILAVPTHFIAQIAKRLKPYLAPDSLIINAGKGIENETLRPIHQILAHELGPSIETATISGPTFALEIAKGAPSALVAAAKSIETAERIQKIMTNSRLKVFTSTDLIGVETGGALKNVIAIAAGISDGLQLGHNARAALITRGLVEISRIGTALGARPETFSGLSGMGDLVLTCTGDLSRNRSVGLKLGQGQSLADIMSNMKMVAEGVKTVKSAHDLKQKFDLQASVIEETYQILYENKPPSQALKDLLKVNITSEFAGVRGLS